MATPISAEKVAITRKKTQARILRETEGMTDEEVREYFRQGAERFDEETTKQRRAEREVAASVPQS